MWKDISKNIPTRHVKKNVYINAKKNGEKNARKNVTRYVKKNAEDMSLETAGERPENLVERFAKDML